MTTAKKVFDWERGTWIQDRTKNRHNIGKFDVDFHAKGVWNYDSSSKDYEEAKKFAQQIFKELSIKSRVVDATTGEILFEVGGSQ